MLDNMIVLNLKNKEYLLKENINLYKKMIQLLIYIINQFKAINHTFYCELRNFKEWVINIIKVINQLINNTLNNIFDNLNICQIKLACVHAIIDDIDKSCIGDCGDTSINLNIQQLLYYYLNKIMQNVIDFCLNTNNILIDYHKNLSEMFHINLIKCISNIIDILNLFYNTSIQNLSPISKKFNYNLVNNRIHNTIEPLLIPNIIN